LCRHGGYFSGDEVRINEWGQVTCSFLPVGLEDILLAPLPLLVFLHSCWIFTELFSA
jgi:hypothetical protein